MQEVRTTYAKDYQQPAFVVQKTRLRFELAKGVTRVTSHIQFCRQIQGEKQPLSLHGQELKLISVKINGEELDDSKYKITDEQLIIADVPDEFTMECVTDIYPEENTSLEGLYQSNGMYCTQCEAEGFRKITYYLDRPDVLSEFETTIVADKDSFPVMLSNGNCISDEIVGDKRVVVWHDPFKKPCYLFALVAGDLQYIEDSFVTISGREVVIRIFVEEKDLNKCDHAMLSLKNAMRWDEEVYGREYDLDIFMIVAVDHFNMGAMENKGLNIFNTSCVLADPLTTTDAGFERVEAVVAHEYFHNWSGNRVTFRDWFQLSLKEGFTVFRDAEFSADMNSREVKRVEDAGYLRTVQFAEDAGPMAHPVRPDSYMEISNFYTVTIYEKGAEVVRMLSKLLGSELFRQATDLYFEKYDGQAVTCEDFIVCMEEVSGRDLQQFRRWYTQAGTPELTISECYNEDEALYTLTVSQQTPATPGQKVKLPFHIPLNVALYGDAGALPLKLQGENPDFETSDNTQICLNILQNEQKFVFEGVRERPVPSLLREFSAPVKLHSSYSHEQLARLISIDSDGFCRWDACQSLATDIAMAKVAGDACDDSMEMLIGAYSTLLSAISQEGGQEQDAAMFALMLVLPTDGYLAEQYDAADPELIHSVLLEMKLKIASSLKDQLLEIYQVLSSQIDGRSASACASRSLRNVTLSYLMLLDDHKVNECCFKQYRLANNMTDQIAALKGLLNSDSATDYASEALKLFYQQWQQESLVVNMWLQVQASSEHSETLPRVKALLSHEAFDYTNPNKVRALLAGFCMQNPSQFHQKSGEGYKFLAEQIVYLDKLNPQIAARLLTPLTRWRKLEPVRAGLMRQSLEKIMQHNLSKDVYEVVSKSLGS